MRFLVRSCMGVCALVALAQGQNDRFAASGTVTDPSGAGVPGVNVSLQKPDATRVGTTSTDSLGAFRFATVSPGSFELQFQKEGFAIAKAPIRIPDRSPGRMRIVLKLGDVRQEVTVNESTGQVSIDPAENLDVITLDRQMLDNLPIFDQNYVGAMSQFLDPGSIGTGGVTLVVNGMEQKNIGVSASAIQSVKSIRIRTPLSSHGPGGAGLKSSQNPGPRLITERLISSSGTIT